MCSGYFTFLNYKRATVFNLEPQDFRNQYVEMKFEELNENVDNGLEIVNTCNERSNTNKYDLIDVKTQLEKVSDTIKSSNNIKYLRFLKNKKKLTKKESNISFSFTD